MASGWPLQVRHEVCDLSYKDRTLLARWVVLVSAHCFKCWRKQHRLAVTVERRHRNKLHTEMWRSVVGWVLPDISKTAVSSPWRVAHRPKTKNDLHCFTVGDTYDGTHLPDTESHPRRTESSPIRCDKQKPHNIHTYCSSQCKVPHNVFKVFRDSTRYLQYLSYRRTTAKFGVTVCSCHPRHG